MTRSLPKYAYRQIIIVASIAEVRLLFEETLTLIARHKRDWGREQTCFNPIHYLTLLERKPECFAYRCFNLCQAQETLPINRTRNREVK
ncbi:hypothetical protein [Gimesia sp.]|uniref:hypothetical protein n=1 Tax=Gimesia sp. TaxID=2024833 RepID=UPI0025C5B6FC|nr:hypothetical protein [Gimesia sp.]